TARTSACTRRSRAKPFGLPGPICRPSNEPSIPSAMSITTNGHTKPCRARRPPRCTVAHHASTRPTRHRSSIPATTSSSASPTRGRFGSRKSSCLLPTPSSSTRSVSKRSTTGFGLSISAASYWGALTNATTSSGPRDEVSPMLPVYSVPYLPGCSNTSPPTGVLGSGVDGTFWSAHERGEHRQDLDRIRQPLAHGMESTALQRPERLVVTAATVLLHANLELRASVGVVHEHGERRGHVTWR